jgi:hypothetical protein
VRFTCDDEAAGCNSSTLKTVGALLVPSTDTKKHLKTNIDKYCLPQAINLLLSYLILACLTT